MFSAAASAPSNAAGVSPFTLLLVEVAWALLLVLLLGRGAPSLVGLVDDAARLRRFLEALAFAFAVAAKLASNREASAAAASFLERVAASARS